MYVGTPSSRSNINILVSRADVDGLLSLTVRRPLHTPFTLPTPPCLYPPAIPGAVSRHDDTSFGITRTEIVCTACGGHLGHVFKGEGFPTPSKHTALAQYISSITNVYIHPPIYQRTNATASTPSLSAFTMTRKQRSIRLRSALRRTYPLIPVTFVCVTFV